MIIVNWPERSGGIGILNPQIVCIHCWFIYGHCAKRLFALICTAIQSGLKILDDNIMMKEEEGVLMVIVISDNCITSLSLL